MTKDHECKIKLMMQAISTKSPKYLETTRNTGIINKYIKIKTKTTWSYYSIPIRVSEITKSQLHAKKLRVICCLEGKLEMVLPF